MNVIFHGLSFLFSKSMIAFRYISWTLLIYKLKSIEFKSTKKFLKNQIIMSMKTILILVMQHSGRNYEKGFFFSFSNHIFFSITGRHLLFFFLAAEFEMSGTQFCEYFTRKENETFCCSNHFLDRYGLKKRKSAQVTP